MSRTTIAIQTDTRALITAAAAAEGTTIDGLLRLLLDQRDRWQFWQSFEHMTPQSYATALADDGDNLDVGFTHEDHSLDAEEA